MQKHDPKGLTSERSQFLLKTPNETIILLSENTLGFGMHEWYESHYLRRKKSMGSAIEALLLFEQITFRLIINFKFKSEMKKGWWSAKVKVSLPIARVGITMRITQLGLINNRAITLVILTKECTGGECMGLSELLPQHLLHTAVLGEDDKCKGRRFLIPGPTVTQENSSL
jgi:hypothetical protein